MWYNYKIPVNGIGFHLYSKCIPEPSHRVGDERSAMRRCQSAEHSSSGGGGGVFVSPTLDATTAISVVVRRYHRSCSLRCLCGKLSYLLYS